MRGKPRSVVLSAEASAPGGRASAARSNPSSTARGDAAAPPRVVVDGIAPQVDSGRFAARRVLGEEVRVTALAYCDGHDRVAALLRSRAAGSGDWSEQPMQARGQDRFEAIWLPEALGIWEYEVEAWIDAFATWREGLRKKISAGLDVSSELLEGAELVRGAAARARGKEAKGLREAADLLGDPDRARAR